MVKVNSNIRPARICRSFGSREGKGPGFYSTNESRLFPCRSAAPAGPFKLAVIQADLRVQGFQGSVQPGIAGERQRQSPYVQGLSVRRAPRFWRHERKPPAWYSPFRIMASMTCKNICWPPGCSGVDLLSTKRTVCMLSRSILLIFNWILSKSG